MEQAPARRRKNRFFDEGLARDDLDCETYVVFIQLGGSDTTITTDDASWSDVTYEFRIYSRSRHKAQQLKDYLVCQWIPRIQGFCLPCGFFCKQRSFSHSDERLLGSGYRYASVAMSGRLYKDVNFGYTPN